MGEIWGILVKKGEIWGEFEGFWTTMTKISGILAQNGENLG